MNPEDLIKFIDWDRVWFALVLIAAGWGLQILVARFLDDLGERLTERRLFLKKVAALSRFAIWGILVVVVASTVLVLESEAAFALSGLLVAVHVGREHAWAISRLASGAITGGVKS